MNKGTTIIAALGTAVLAGCGPTWNVQPRTSAIMQPYPGGQDIDAMRRAFDAAAAENQKYIPISPPFAFTEPGGMPMPLPNPPAPSTDTNLQCSNTDEAGFRRFRGVNRDEPNHPITFSGTVRNGDIKGEASNAPSQAMVDSIVQRAGKACEEMMTGKSPLPPASAPDAGKAFDRLFQDERRRHQREHRDNFTI